MKSISKLTLQSAQLKEVLAELKKVNGNKASITVCAFVKVEPNGDEHVTLTATDLEFTVYATFEATLSGQPFLFNLLEIYPLVDKPDAELLEMECFEYLVPNVKTGKDDVFHRVTVTCGDDQLATEGESYDDFPATEQNDCVDLAWVHDTDWLHTSFKDLHTLASSDPQRPAMSGLGMMCDPVTGRLRLAATDAHVLAIFERVTPFDASYATSWQCFNKGVVKLLSKITKASQVRMQRFKSLSTCFGFMFDVNDINYTVAVRQIDGRYPAVDGVIPETCKLGIISDKSDIKAAFAKVAAMKFEFTDITHEVGKGFALVSEDVSKKKSFTRSFEAKTDRPFDQSGNLLYLHVQNTLRLLSLASLEDEVTLLYASRRHALCVKQSGDDYFNTFLVMPCAGSNDKEYIAV